MNIARVEDLLAELNGNYAHLGLQAAAAREYVGYQSRVRDLDMDIAHARYLSVLREQGRATARLAEAQEKMAEVITSLNSRQAAHDDLQTAQRKLSASLRDKATALSEAREDAYRLEKELVSVREKAKYLAAEESRLVRQEQDWDASRLQTTRLADETGTSIDQLRSEESQAGAELVAEQRTYDEVIQGVEQRRKGLAQAQAQVLQLETEVRQLFSRFNPLQFELDEKRKTVELSGQAIGIPEPETAAEQVNDVREQTAALEKTLEERRGQSEGASRELTMLEQEQAALAADSKDRAMVAESYRKSLKNAAAFVASLERQIRNGSTARRVLDVVDLGERGPLLLQLLREELGIELSDDPCDALAVAVRRSGQATMGVRYAPGDDAVDRKDVAASSVAAMATSLAGAPLLVGALLRRLFVASSLEQGLVFAREHRHDFYKVYCEDGFVIDSAFAVRPLRGSIEHSFAGKDSAELARLEAEAAEALRITADQAQAVALARHKRSELLSGIQQTERDLKQAQARLQAMVVEQERRLAVEHERATRLDTARSRIVELEKELAPPPRDSR